MRLVIDSLIALMMVSILAGVLVCHRLESAQIESLRQVHRALASLQEQVLYHGALSSARNGDDDGTLAGASDRFPQAVNPLWFKGDLPENPMVPGRQPWIDVAPAGDMADNPPDPVILGPSQAAFWYNPARGIFRARVNPQFTEQDTLDLYNKVNNAGLRTLAIAADVDRIPRPMDLRLALTAPGESVQTTVREDAFSQPSNPPTPQTPASRAGDARPSLLSPGPSKP